MTKSQLDRLRRLIDDGQEERFYSWRDWKRLSHIVRTRLDNCECQKCKARGKYAPAEIVHHVQRLRERPDLALSIYDPETKKRNLISLCRACHELEHPERLRPAKGAAAKPLTEERWD
jgi:hypothetical protein